ncbi:hypothetical protein [Rhizobium leguminosarum]|uniref:hypothetical protein n=1 Tax=Rhizobium leguminosarum TaxID=384 RepID=UPI001C947D2A|nr:hypothetical protein [Rhizobium leguminosarum]MBY5315336.1 hypothetical protein [Rhizobium leguminosarum]MBY5376198.1 hypothetical protein [Rhizobium leguminosarum]
MRRADIVEQLFPRLYFSRKVGAATHGSRFNGMLFNSGTVFKGRAGNLGCDVRQPADSSRGMAWLAQFFRSQIRHHRVQLDSKVQQSLGKLRGNPLYDIVGCFASV